MVTTPQGLATMIVRKGVFLAQLMSVPISGVVENMAYYTCPETGLRHEIFGPSHAHEVTEIACAPLLARLPIDPSVVARCDAGQIEDVQLPELPALMSAFLEAVPL
jgi:Mrp family chromosome partitioning ATPase